MSDRKKMVELASTIARAVGEPPIYILVPALMLTILALHSEMDRKQTDLLIYTLQGLIDEVENQQVAKESAEPSHG